VITNPQVIHETIDGETIVIDLASGTYYSLQGAGPVIWNAIAAGESPDQVADRLAVAYPDEPDAAATVRSFVAELQAEGLLVPNGSPPAGAPAPLPAGEAPAAFAPPTLEKYTDMQDIILLDPVHEVGERGWPHTDAATS
jgi:Coenzyme PQQ synthesis protein D (PqqD)